MKTTLFLSILSAVILSSSFAKADGVQICVDGNQSRYKVDIEGFANEGTAWSGVIHSLPSDAVRNGTNLRSLEFVGNLADSNTPAVEELAFTLKAAAPLVSANENGTGGGGPYLDEPRVYKMGALDVICTSTMSADEYAQMPN